MPFTPSQKIFGRLAGIIGFLQGLTWSGLSLTCIIMYYLDNYYNIADYSTTDYLNVYLNNYYLAKSANIEQWRTIRSSDFIILMWIYLIFSVGWTIVSVDLFISIQYNFKRSTLLNIVWGILTILISFIDLVITALLLRDFLNCPETNALNYYLCNSAIGTVMCLASRGFILWIVNVTVALSEIVSGIKIINHNQVLAARGEFTIPRAKLDKRITGSIDNISRYVSNPSKNQTSPTHYYNHEENRLY